MCPAETPAEVSQVSSAFQQALGDCLTEGKLLASNWPAFEKICRTHAMVSIASAPSLGAIVEEAASAIKPGRWLSVFDCFEPSLIEHTMKRWDSACSIIFRMGGTSDAYYRAICHAYIAFEASRLADCFENHFTECHNSATFRGDAYVSRNGTYYYHFDYFCGDTGLSRQQAIDGLRGFAARLRLSCGHEDALSTSAFHEVEAWCGESAGEALRTWMPLFEVSAEAVLMHVCPRRMGSAVITAIMCSCGLSMPITSLLEICELCALWKMTKHESAKFIHFARHLLAFEDEDKSKPCESAPKAWLKEMRAMRRRYGDDAVRRLVSDLLPLYSTIGQLMGGVPCYRRSIAWMASTFTENSNVSWLASACTNGELSPVKAIGLLHEDTSPALLSALARQWQANLSEQTPWDKSTLSLILRYLISRQRHWILNPLVDLYARCGSDETPLAREDIVQTLKSTLDALKLTPCESSRIASMALDFCLLPQNTNIFTGEAVDASRWASPASAHKYVRALLKLSTRNGRGLLNMITERRRAQIEKTLRRLDYHSSLYQIIACSQAFSEDEDALHFLLLLGQSCGERPSAEWLEAMNARLSRLDKTEACDLLWTCCKHDQGDALSLNPGLFWAFRLVPASPHQLARAACDALRINPTFALAALDTLDTIATRSSLAAILDMRRKIRHRQVHKRILQTIDRIATREGLSREVFLDYSADTGDLGKEGERCFDFGTCRIVLKIDSDVRVTTQVFDTSGKEAKKLRNIPKSLKPADPDLFQTFQTAKKHLQETLTYQTGRMEQAMIEARFWRGHDLIEIFQNHPMMRHICRRLVCAQFDAASKTTLGDGFVVADDGCLNAKGNRCDIMPDDTYVIQHPIHMFPTAKHAWKQHFDARGLTQPFPQLQRETFRPSPDDFAHPPLSKLIGLALDIGKMHQIVKERGWKSQTSPWENGNFAVLTRTFAAHGQTVHLITSEIRDQSTAIAKIAFVDTHSNNPLCLDAIDTRAFSEACRDIHFCLISAPETDAA